MLYNVYDMNLAATSCALTNEMLLLDKYYLDTQGWHHAASFLSRIALTRFFIFHDRLSSNKQCVFLVFSTLVFFSKCCML